jgi:hypothetical protein
VATQFPKYIPRRGGPGVAKVPDRLRGENHYRAKLTQADVDEMRADRANGMSIEDVFIKFHARCDISYSNVRRVLSFLSWK